MRPDRLYLEDIVGAADAVGRFLSGVGRERFLGDELLQSAVLHQLMIVGEAAGRISAETKAAHPMDGRPADLVPRQGPAPP